MSWWNPLSWLSPDPKEYYSRLCKDFLENYKSLRKVFDELKDMVKGKENVEEIFKKWEQLYEIYRILSQLSSRLLSINRNWNHIDSQISWFDRGLIYLFKHKNNFNYDLVLDNTLTIMENSLNKIKKSLTELGLET
ncbi:hypothetical protein HYX04_00465 [Candidatus Woesearchaeota archaeon]|nr:hypothetical protein [Candidatus Woesearchaeota archaeon]